MKRIKTFIKNNIKITIVFAISIITTGVIGAYAATVINSSEVSYTSNGQTTVQGAIDDLYTLSNTWINPSYVDFTTLDTNAKQTILASKNGVCIKRNNKVSCFKANNWEVEKDHIQEVFSDVGTYNSSTELGCKVQSSNVECVASDFYIYMNLNGGMILRDKSDNSQCYVGEDGTVDCGKVKVDGIENVGFQTNTAKTIFANSSGLCLTRKKKTSCFKKNNWAVEKDHIQQVFSDISCTVNSSSVDCGASDFGCSVNSSGGVGCRDRSDSSRCDVTSAGTVSCN